MSKIIRLTESDLIRLVKRIINENEEPELKSCPTTVGRFMNKLVNNLTPEELKSIIMVYRNEGKEGLKYRIEQSLEGSEIMENKKNSNFESAIHKIAKVVALSSGAFLGTATLILPCLEGVSSLENPPSWFQDIFTGGVIASIPLALASAIVLQLTEKEK